jgi:ectoine hydroxylase-related dioxygenase (phytanoyl-CoA dioxygenase family)
MLVLLGLSVVTTACDSRKAEAASTEASSAVVAKAAQTALANEVKTKIERIVFVGKEHACDCTRKKVETAQAALHKLLGNPAKIPVETLMADTEEAQVEPYRQMKPMMALPAIYFIDGKGGLVEMLQGEVTEAQVSKVLGL